MDISMVYVLIIMTITILLSIGVNWLVKKKYIDESSIVLVAQILGVASGIVSEMGFKDPKIVKISEIVKTAIDGILQETKDYKDINKLKEDAYNITINLCISQNIKLNSNREALIKQIIDLILPLAIKSIVEQENKIKAIK